MHDMNPVDHCVCSADKILCQILSKVANRVKQRLGSGLVHKKP